MNLAYGLVTHANYRTDPTQTTVIRGQFASSMVSRFRKLKKVVGSAVSAERLRTGLFFVDEFMGLLVTEERALIFEDEAAAWMEPFVAAAYVRGLQHADRTTGFRGTGVPPIMLDGLVNYQEEIAVIQAQNFRLLQGVTEVMNQQIREVLIRGITQGLGPEVVARLIADRIERIGRLRAELIARTETIRAHAEATLKRFGEYGIAGVSGQAEFRTAGDGRVCPICAGLDGTVFSLTEARGVIPKHPRCRCVWLPVINFQPPQPSPPNPPEGGARGGSQ